MTPFDKREEPDADVVDKAAFWIFHWYQKEGGPDLRDRKNARDLASFLAANLLRTPAGRPDREARSTLARGDEIEADFYQLKAQEFATTPEHIRTRVLWSLGAAAPSEAEARI